MLRIRGSSLPLALVLTSMFIMAGIGIGVVVLEESNRAREGDQSVSAYYMADSGVERQLFEVRKRDATVASFAGLNVNYPNQGSWVFSGSYASTSQKNYSSIATSSFEVIDLFDPDNVVSAGVDHLDITWVNGSDCVGGFNAGMEVAYTDWTTVGGVISLSSASTIVRSPSGQYSLTVTLNTSKAYRVRLSSYGCAAGSVQVGAKNPTNGLVGFPGNITLSSQGTYGKTTQQITVTMPKTNVLSGIYSYVIFSECTILKGMGTPVCPP